MESGKRKRKAESAAERAPAESSTVALKKPKVVAAESSTVALKKPKVVAAESSTVALKKPKVVAAESSTVALKKPKVVAAESSTVALKKPKVNDAPMREVRPAVLELAQVQKTALDVPQVDRAVRALLSHVQRERGTAKTSLLDGLDAEPPVHVLLSTKAMPKAIGKAKASKPVPLGLPHPYMSLETAEICLITKDPQREYKDKLAALGLRAKVIGVSKLKKKHKEYEAKRALLRAYEVFLADARVLPMLPPLLGKGFFVKRKLPVAVDLTKKDLRGELEKGVCSALYRHGAGTSNSMQVGTCVQTPAQLVENVVAAVEQAVRLIPGKWSNVQSLSLRTTNSVALPFYNSMPHE